MPDSRLVLANFLPFRLSVLSNMVSSAIAAGYAERCGISIPEWRVIAVLAESPGLAAAEVAARTVMDKVAVSRAVATLLAKRHIHRSQSRRDRRRRTLSLSKSGQSVYATVVPMALGYERALIDTLSAAEKRQMDAVLRKLMGRAAELGPAHEL